MKRIIEEEFCGNIEEDMFFPNIIQSKTNNDTYYPEKNVPIQIKTANVY